MSDSDNKKPRRTLKNLPPDRFQPKMLLFWLALVAVVIALFYLSPNLTTAQEMLTIQDVVERDEAGNIVHTDPNQPNVIRPDPSGGLKDWVTIVGMSRPDANSKPRPFHAAGRLTDAD